MYADIGGITHDILIPLATVFITLAGLWLAHNYRRQMALKLAETRLKAYAQLWALTGIAAPIRSEGWGDEGFLEPDERRALWDAMTAWYYSDGNGMLLGETSKTVYLNAKHNLVCTAEYLRPEGLDVVLKHEIDGHEINDKIRGNLSIRQLSLLRNQLKSDLKIYGQTFSPVLGEHELFFLEYSKVDLRSRAWRRASGSHIRFRRLGERFHAIREWARAKAGPHLDAVKDMKDSHECAKKRIEADRPVGAVVGFKGDLDVAVRPASPQSARAAVEDALIRPPEYRHLGGQPEQDV